MRISDWSSDVGSSDLNGAKPGASCGMREASCARRPARPPRRRPRTMTRTATGTARMAEATGPTVFDHLLELRSRLLRGVAGLLLVFVAELGSAACRVRGGP